MKATRWVTVGVIVAAHGIGGEVRVKPLTDFPERFETTRTLFIEKGDGERDAFIVERARVHAKGLYILKLKGVSDRNAAEELRSFELQIPRDEVMPLPDDSYYVFDLLGTDVITIAGEKLGELVDVLQTGANDVFHVRDAVGKEILIPALKSIVQVVDLKSGRIVVDLPEGLL